MMKKFKKIISSPITTIAAFALAAGLLLFSSIGGARAALTYFSDNYEADIQMHEIGVTLVENGNQVAGELLANLLIDENGAAQPLKLGKAYTEELSVYNSGVINEYVRVNIYKYWVDKDGRKLQTLSPDLIELNLTNLGSDWILDEAAATDERTVLYYSRVLESGETTPLFADQLTIDGEIVFRVSEERTTSGGYTTITTTYEYDGAKFCVEVKVDGVQEHNAQDAIWSAWGRRVVINDGSLSLD